MLYLCSQNAEIISIHALRVEGDRPCRPNSHNRNANFYPRPPGGGRRLNLNCQISPAYFYPRPPGGGRRKDVSVFERCRDFYPRPPGGGRQKTLLVYPARRCISIHALRVEGDHPYNPKDKVHIRVFLSTPSGWRATSLPCTHTIHSDYFYPRPPGGGRRCVRTHLASSIQISIHALRVEGDCCTLICDNFKNRFLSTPSGWRATFREQLSICYLVISIHALRVEGDVFQGY